MQTPSWPPPDASRREAIRQVFAHPLSCILGPPGTSKSQTIAALIDELLCRRPSGPLKILVSAASYEPMSVVLDKLQAHRDDGDLFLHLDRFAFDLVVVDEASQMPVDQATTLLPLIHRGAVEAEPLGGAQSQVDGFLGLMV